MVFYITLNIWFMFFFCQNGGLTPDPSSRSEIKKSASPSVSSETKQPEKASS
jgi:hypothetical protein